MINLSLDIPAHPLKDKLRKRNISQLIVARQLGISISSLSQYLNGYRSPPPEIESQLNEIAQQLEGEIHV